MKILLIGLLMVTPSFSSERKVWKCEFPPYIGPTFISIEANKFEWISGKTRTGRTEDTVISTSYYRWSLWGYRKPTDYLHKITYRTLTFDRVILEFNEQTRELVYTMRYKWSERSNNSRITCEKLPDYQVKVDLTEPDLNDAINP